MALNAAALRLMAAKGLSASDIVEIAEAMEVRKDPGAAARQQRRRARLREEGSGADMTAAPTRRGRGGVTRDSAKRDVTDGPSPEEYISNPHPDSPSPDGDRPQNPDMLLAAWNAAAARAGLRAAARLTEERRRRIRARLAEHGEAAFRRAIAAAAASPFCRGENERGWRADLDFLLQPRSFVRLIEGFYGGDPDAPAAAWTEARKAQLLASIRARDEGQGRAHATGPPDRRGGESGGIGKILKRLNVEREG